MLRKLFLSFSVALQNIRSNPLHTTLSTLGIVIGVAALVSILALVDGMERYARDQITQTTSIKSIIVETPTTEYINGVWVDKKDYPVISAREAAKLKEYLPEVAQLNISMMHSGAIEWGDSSRVGGFIEGIGTIPPAIGDYIAAGRAVNNADISNNRRVGLVGHELAGRLANGRDPETIIGTKVIALGRSYEIVGILKETGRPGRFRMYVPLGSVPGSVLRQTPPRIVVEAMEVEEVPVLEEKVRQYLGDRYGPQSDQFRIRTQAARVEQANQGLMLFKLVMGLITGISVVVGGIGVMNVLLVSVTERTPEIGIRKAAGAKKRDIMLQFLSESVAISGLGSLLGLIFGIGFTLIFIPVIKQFTDVPFQAAFTGNTFLIIGLLALLVGIVFGTYPAMRAARLTPVEAIRRE